LKTNAIRILESKNISFETVEYEFNEDEIDAISVAKKLGVNSEIVFKTLVAHNEENNFYVFVIPGCYELNLKKAAKACNSKK